MRLFAGTPLLLALLAAPSAAQLNSYITQEDVEGYRAKAQAAVKNAKDPEGVYFGTKLLLALGKEGDVKAACETAAKLVTGSPGDLKSVAYGGAAAKAAGCPVSLGSVEAKVSETLTTAYQSESFSVKYPAILGSVALGTGVTDIEPALKKLTKHYRDNEGLFKELPDDRSGTSDGTFAVLELIAQAVRPEVKQSSKGIKHTLEKAANLLPGVLGEVDARVDATIISGLAQASNEPLQLSDSQLLSTAQGLLALKASPSVKVAYKVYSGLKVVSSFANAPVALLLSQALLRRPSDALKLQVKTILGQPVSDGASVTIERVTLPAQGKEFESYRDRSFKGSADGTFTAGDLSLEPGVYEVSLIVGLKGDRSTSIAKSIVVKAPVAISSTEVVVSASRKPSDGKSYRGSLPSGVSAASGDGDWLHVSFELDSATPPHQAFLRLTHVETGLDTFYTMRKKTASSSSSEGSTALSVSFSLAEEMATFLQRSGAYQLSLLVGDVVYDSPIEQSLGSLSLSFPPKTKTLFPLYTRPLLYESDNALSALPVINHQFRQPEKRPSPVVSLFFTGLIGLALFAFVLSLRSVGANLKGLPGGLGFIWTVLLFGSLGGFALFYTAYFVSIKMMTLLTYLLPLSLFTVFTGHKAFTASAAKRLSAAAASSSSAAATPSS